ELPDLAKRQVTGAVDSQWRRAGFSTSGSPSAISVERTLRNSLARRVALRRPRPEELEALEAELRERRAAGEPEAELAPLEERLSRLRRRMKVIPYIDPLDLRFRRLEETPRPIAQAVMFCLMDVSGSMDEHMKDLAKRFYSLLYLFLRRRYEHVDVVFIRHTHVAQEVDEDTFFYARETGGTIVSTALEMMANIARERYPLDSWNIYAAQASDGDNASSDNPKAATLLTEEILPICQYFAYIEVGAEEERPFAGADAGSALWRTYALVAQPDAPMAMRKVRHRREIYPVFRDLFAREGVPRAVEA
ncbi:MAG: YeaH/YhbH family protein, partial [Hyphomonadaceae bacterium]|nr:YeaH/YhbH family protein [Hyphomonadaceae bacterium]